MTATAKPRQLVPSDRPVLPFDATIIVALISVGCVGLTLALGALLLSGWSNALGVAVGAITATVNLWLFAYIGRGILAGGPRSRLFGLLAALKFVALLGVAYLLMRSQLTSGLMLAVGYGSLPVGIAVSMMLRPRANEAGSAQGDLVRAAPSDVTNEFLPPAEGQQAEDDTSLR